MIFRALHFSSIYVAQYNLSNDYRAEHAQPCTEMKSGSGCCQQSPRAQSCGALEGGGGLGDPLSGRNLTIIKEVTKQTRNHVLPNHLPLLRCCLGSTFHVL